MSEIYKVLTNIFIMISHYEDEIEQIRIQLNTQPNFDLIELYSMIGKNKPITAENLFQFYFEYYNGIDINKEELLNYLSKIIFFYDEDKNNELSYSEFISFVLSQTKYNLRRKIHNNINLENKSLSKDIIYIFNTLVEKEIEMIQSLENFERKLYSIKDYNPNIIFNQIKSNNYITPASIIKVLDSQGIKNSNNEIQRIMKRFDINGNCRIELNDFITIMNFAKNNKFKLSNNLNYPKTSREYIKNNYNLNYSNDFFFNKPSQTNINLNYNLIDNENKFNIGNGNNKKIKRSNSMGDILDSYKINHFGFNRQRKNILKNYFNENNFRKSRIKRHNSLDNSESKQQNYLINSNYQKEIKNNNSNYQLNETYKKNKITNLNDFSEKTKKIIFQNITNKSINISNYQNENNNKNLLNLNESITTNYIYNNQKKIDISMLITGYIKVVISMEFEIEKKKIELLKREDFSIKGLYKLFESQTYPNKITISSFNRVLTLFGKELTSRELFLLFKRFDIGQKGYLIYEDFFNIFIPFEKRIRDSVILNYIVPKEISKKTLIKMIEIIECIIEFEIQLEKMRYEMNASENDIIDYFHLIDKNNNGFIYYDDIQFFLLNYLEDNIENRIGIDLFFLRLDKKRNDKIIFKELYDELKH